VLLINGDMRIGCQGGGGGEVEARLLRGVGGMETRLFYLGMGQRGDLKVPRQSAPEKGKE